MSYSVMFPSKNVLGIFHRMESFTCRNMSSKALLTPIFVTSCKLSSFLACHGGFSCTSSCVSFRKNGPLQILDRASHKAFSPSLAKESKTDN